MLEYDLNTLVWHKRHELMGTLGRGFHAAVVVNLSPEEAVCGNVV